MKLLGYLDLGLDENSGDPFWSMAYRSYHQDELGNTKTVFVHLENPVKRIIMFRVCDPIFDELREMHDALT